MSSKTKTSITLLLALSLILLTFNVTLVNATEDSWATKVPMQQARSGLGVAAVNGKIYAIGGVISGGFVPSSPGSAVYAGKTPVDVTGSNEEYDPETDTWTYKAAMPTPRAVFAIAVYQNKIYCLGGKTSNSYTGVNEVYDPATDTWETKTSMPTARAFLRASVVGDKIYLIGGHGLSPDEFLLVNEVYDPVTDTWSSSEPMLSGTLFGYASAVCDNKIYIIGGLSQDHVVNQIYDTETDTWIYGTSPPSGVGGGAAATTTGDLAPKRIYVIGNTNVGVYDPDTDTWSNGTQILTTRFNLGVAIVNDVLYAIGGHTYSFIPGNYEPLAVNEQYTPIGYIPEFTSWIILPLLLAATLVALLCKQRLPKTAGNGLDGCKPKLTALEACHRLVLSERQKSNT